jgi:signal peptidase I
MGFLSMIPAPLRGVVELLLTVVVAIAIALAAQAWVVKPYRVPTTSMVPTLEPGDRVLADRLTLRFRDPERYEIVVFHPPACTPEFTQQGICSVPDRSKRTGPSSETFIKRVIGLPGETVSARNGHVFITSPGGVTTRLAEPYLADDVTTVMRDGPVKVPPGFYFMMGDNRGDSEDSRAWGVEPREDILGIARIRYWPIDRLGSP